MDKKVMDDHIRDFLEYYEQTQKYNAPMKINAVKKLIVGDAKYSFKSQQKYEDPEYL